jgi:hypothetical protein
VGVSTRNSAPWTGDSRFVQARTSGAQTRGVHGSRACDIVSDPACHGACSKGQAPRHASALERRDAFEEAAGLALTTYGRHRTTRCILAEAARTTGDDTEAATGQAHPAVAHRARIRRYRLRLEGVEQQDAADEAGASHGASLLILVFYGRPARALERRGQHA